MPLAQVVVDQLAAHMAVGFSTPKALFTVEGGKPLRYRAWKPVWARSNARRRGGPEHARLRRFTASA